MLDDMKPMEQIVWACAFAQSCNHVFADMIVERYRDEMQRRAIEATAPKKSTAAKDGTGGEHAGERSTSDSGGGERPCTTQVPAGPEVSGGPADRTVRTLLEDIGFLPRRPADPEDQGDDDLND